jgi:hypothetical protein
MISQFPTYYDWYLALKATFRDLGKKIRLQDFTMAGNSTNLKVILKDSDTIQASQPYMELTFIRAQDGHDDNQSGQKAWNTSKYDRQGTSNKFTKSKNTILERLEFQVDIFANRQEHALAIIQEMKRLVKPIGTLDVVKNENTFTVAYHFESGEMITENQQSTGHFENYRCPYLITLFIESDFNADVQAIPAISAVVLNYSGSLSTISGSGGSDGSSSSDGSTGPLLEYCCPLTGAVDFYTQGRLDAQGLLLNSSGSLILSSSTSEVYVSGNLRVLGSIYNTVSTVNRIQRFN